MADQAARTVTLQVRVTPQEVDLLERIGRRMTTGPAPYSDVRKVDGSINTSAVIRHLVGEEARAKGYVRA
jgi:hypothetical protein